MTVLRKDVAIQSPCTATLDPKRGDDGAKRWHCDHCAKSVHVLSNMTESEARDLLDRNVGQELCVSYRVRADSSIRFRPEPPPLVPVASLTRRRAAAVAAFGLSAALAACTPHGPTEGLAGELVLQSELDADHSRPPPTIPTEELMVEGGLRPEPVPEPEPESEPEPERLVKQEYISKPGAMKVRPLPKSEPEAREPSKTDEDEPCPNPDPDPDPRQKEEVFLGGI